MYPTMYLKLNEGGTVVFPYTLANLQEDNRNTSFPRNPPDTLLAQFSMFPVEVLPQPEFDQLTQYAELQSTPYKPVLSYYTAEDAYNSVGDYDASLIGQPKEVENRWVVGWNIVNKPEDIASECVINTRNELLQQTDWMALSDTPPLTPEWEAYRQSLRDITDQPTFPYDLVWPTPPS